MTTMDVVNSVNSNPRTPKNTLGKQDFLNLLVSQMRNQDPLDPMKGTEFAAQLAQFSSLEQLTNLNTSMSMSLDANAILTQSINNGLSATFIGKDVRAAVDTFQYTGEGDVKVGYDLPSDASAVTVKVYDSNGTLVRTMNGDTGKGQSTLTWDGKSDKGANVASGKYSFKVEAVGTDGKTMAADKYVFGTISGVRFKPEGTVFVIDGMEIALGNILEIMEGG
jgi:flagellar basal-body rod modification protein FlgD